MLYKKLLVPVDGSEHAMLACRHAVALADEDKTEIVLLHCYGDLPNAIGGKARKDLIAACEKDGMKMLAKAIKLCEEGGIPYIPAIQSGAPGREIVLAAQKHGCDLIIMGSRGLSDFSGMVMGSVSHRVLRHATIPVLIVR